MLKGRRFKCKRHLNQLRPRHIKNVTQKDSEELPMEVIYDTFEIPVPISPTVPMEVSPTPPVPEVLAPQKLLIPQVPPAQKLVGQESIREQKKLNDYASTPKKGSIE